MWFFTADLHLNHSNIIKYSKRPFMNQIELGLMELVDNGSIPLSEISISKESTQLMTDAIIDSINAVVGRRDKLIIIGDFCYSRSKDREKYVGSLRSRINCQNVHLIIGNHDDRKVCEKFFECADQYMFNVNGQQIFTNHYPCRSWDKRLYGSWMLYGHVHGAYCAEDINGMSLDQENKIRENFSFFIKDPIAVDAMIETIRSSKPKLKTLDVGVDNRRDGIPFGTPWSFDEIKKYMNILTQLS